MYAIVGTISDNNYQGFSNGTFTINKALVNVNLTNLNQTYDGTPKSVFSSTTPVTVSVAVTYDGSSTPPTNAGTYTVVGSVTDSNYTGTNTVQLTIGKAAATVMLSNLSQPFDGTPKSVGVTTNPPGLPVDVAYNGSATAPIQPGSYPVMATIDSGSNYQGTASGTLTITAPPQPIATQTQASSLSATASPNSQTIQLSATVTPIGGTAAINEGTVTFSILDGSALVGTAVTSGTVSGGNVSAQYVLPANTSTKVYTISAVYSGTANFASSSDTARTLTVFLAGGTQPPAIQSLTIDRNPAVVGTNVTITANGKSFSGLPLTYTFTLFQHDGSTPLAPNPLQVVGPTTSPGVFTQPFNTEGDFDIGVIANDGFNANSAAQELNIFPLGPNPGTTQANILNDNGAQGGATNPTDGLGISVSSSMGGALNFDGSSGTPSVRAAGDTFTFTIPEQTYTDPNRQLTAGKFTSSGIRVVTLDAMIGGVAKKARLMLPIGKPETGESFPGTDTRTNKGATISSLKAKLSQNKISSVAMSCTIEVAEGLALTDMSDIQFGLSAIHTEITVNTKGKVPAVLLDPTHFPLSKIKVKMPKVVKATGKTAKGATIGIVFTLTGTGMDLAAAGLGTDGINPVVNPSRGQMIARDLQFASIVGGITSQQSISVIYTPNSDFGTVAGRK